MLFAKDDTTTTECTHCQEDRYQNQGSNIPRRTFQMLSIGDQISLALLNKDTREKMLYRSQFEYDPEVSTDTFSGKRYQNLLERGFFAGQNDVALILQIDGFSPSDKGNTDKLNMVQIVNMNLPPQSRLEKKTKKKKNLPYYRYQKEYLIQLCVLPGPRSPADYDTFLLPIVSELKDLEAKGLTIQIENGDYITFKVYLLCATGDIPAVTSISKHAGHVSSTSCRICKEKAVKYGRGRYTLPNHSDLRDTQDYTYGNIVSLYCFFFF